MKHCTNLKVVCMALLCLLSTFDGHAQCTLACNDQVQISLDQNGLAVVLPDMMLDGEESTCPGTKTVDVMHPSGAMIGNTIRCEFVGGVLSVQVMDDTTGLYCWGTILVEDKLPPQIICQDTTVNCTANISPDSLGFPLISDNCFQPLDTTYFDNVVISQCTTDYSAVLTRTWHVTDASENISLPCVQTISVVRPSLADVEFPLNFDNVEQPALACPHGDTSLAFTGAPMIDSIPINNLCKISFSYEDLVVGACGFSFSVLRRFTVLDCCSGEIITHDQLIKVEDNHPPVFGCPDTLTFNANGPGCAGTFMLPALPVSDDCSGVVTIRTITPTGTIEDNGGLVFGLPMGQYTVDYEAHDGCGNVSHCEVVVNIEDRTVPVAICDEITQVSLTSGGTANIAATTFDDGSYDECCPVTFLARRMDEPNAPFLPEVILGCDDIGDSTLVVVQVSDCYGNANQCMVSVLTDDKLPPDIVCPPDVAVSCTELLPIPVSVTGEPTAIENCEVADLIFTDFENLNACNTGFIRRRWSVTDVAGFSDHCDQRISLIDNTESSFIFPADTLADCSGPIDSISAGEAMALGDCEAWALNVSDEIFPVDCGLKIFRTYTFLDWCSGLDTSHTQFIEVRDTNPPVWDQPIGSKDTSYVCPGDLVKPGPPTATDYCSPMGAVEVFLVKDTIEFMGCPNRFVRTFTYTAMDTCGNVAEPFFTKIFVNDTIPPTANVPDRFYSCLDEIPLYDVDSVDAFDNCPSPVTVELIVEDTLDNGCTGRVVRTYRITDVCGLTAEISQNFIWADTIPPSANNMTLGPFPCLENVPGPDPATLMAIDNCKDTVLVEHLMDSINVEFCNGVVRRTWRLTDVCGNDTVLTQILTVLDTVAPSMNCPVAVNVPILTETCEVQISITVDAVDNCLGNPVLITNDHGNGGAEASGIFPLGRDTVNFRAVDTCGNSASCAVPINITELIPPTITCGAIISQFDSTGLVVLDIDSLRAAGDIDGVDACTDVTFDLSFDTLDCMLYDSFFVDSLGIAIMPYKLIVADSFNNQDSCFSSIFLSDPLDSCNMDDLLVGGMVTNGQREPLANFETQLIDGNDMTYSMTSEHGWYHFAGVPPGANCMLKPYKNDDLRNGVTTYDLIKISRHILGTGLLDSPYKLIAADANHSGAVSTFDVVLIRKVILFVSHEFPNNNSWRFIKADYEFPDPADPFAEPLPGHAWINNITQDVYDHHFIGIKIGDVNGSASVNFSETAEERSTESITFSTGEQYFQEGTLVEIPVITEDVVSLEALQATLEYDDTKMKFLGILPAELDIKETDYAHPKSGSVTLSWMPHEDTPDGRSLYPDQVVFVLQFKLLEQLDLRKALAMNSTMTQAIAYENGGNPLNVNWRIHDSPHTMEVDAANFVQLLQNQPNPFTNETKVLFYLKEKMPVRLEAVDMAGRKISLINQEMDAGWQEVVTSREELGGGGVYFYQLITPYGSVYRKMVVGDR